MTEGASLSRQKHTGRYTSLAAPTVTLGSWVSLKRKAGRARFQEEEKVGQGVCPKLTVTGREKKVCIKRCGRARKRFI